MTPARFFLRKKITDRIANGHPWVFANEINSREGHPAPGDIVEVLSSNGSFVGKGFYNGASQIEVRLLTHNRSEAIDKDFFLRKIQAAWRYRQQLGYTENARVVFGEADGLPGLIIDKYGDFFVVQTLTLGMDFRKPAVVEALEAIYKPAGILERNDVPVRKTEGLPLQKSFLSASFDPRILISENGLRFEVDLQHGLHTGYYLDQHNNRCAIQHIVRGAEVLSAFSYTGSFEIHASQYGARSVLGIDQAPEAVEAATRNAALNNLSKTVRFQTANAFDALKALEKEGRRYDVVMLHPPAFTKGRETVPKAIAGYKEINLRGMKLLKPGGFLVTSSRTHLISPASFLDIIQQAAHDTRRNLRQVHWSSQSHDHPIRWDIPATHYLKFLIVQVQ